MTFDDMSRLVHHNTHDCLCAGSMLWQLGKKDIALKKQE